MEKYGGTAVKFTITSTYPITSPISFKCAARGTYSIGYDYPDGSQRWESYDYDGLPSWEKLNVGASSWEIIYAPGIQSGGSIDEADWYIDFTEFSDDRYNYEKGRWRGTEYY